MTEHKDASLILNQFIPYRMVNLSKRVSDACSQIYFDKFNLMIPEWRVLAVLAEKGSLNAKSIGEATMMDKSTLSRAIKQLDGKGFLSKSKDSNDHRATYLVLTEAGKKAYHDIVPNVLGWESQLIESLSISEYRDLMRIMDKLDRQLDIMNAK